MNQSRVTHQPCYGSIKLDSFLKEFNFDLKGKRQQIQEEKSYMSQRSNLRQSPCKTWEISCQLINMSWLSVERTRQ